MSDFSDPDETSWNGPDVCSINFADSLQLSSWIQIFLVAAFSGVSLVNNVLQIQQHSLHWTAQNHEMCLLEILKNYKTKRVKILENCFRQC